MVQLPSSCRNATNIIGSAAVSYPSKHYAITSWLGLAGVLFAVVCLSGCLSGGGGGSDAGSTGAPVAPPPVMAPNPITAFADAGGGNVTVTSANTLAPGAIVVISGTTSYNGTFTVVSATATNFNIAAAFVANDATGVWIAGGGVIAGCSTTGATGVIGLPAMTAVASRFTGVAPLSVFFDAKNTTGATQPFHELLYAWSFGDPGSGTWAAGSRAGSSSKNNATGAVAAHVYETPGAYTISLSVTDGTNTVTNNCIQIAVQDPDVVFAGANTRCYTQGAVSAGTCPGGGTEILNASADPRTIVSADLAAGKRLLFARGQTWTTSIGLVPLNVNGPWTIGAYGAGAKPVFRRGAGTVILNVGQVGSDWKDARVMDLQLEDNATNNVIAVNGGGTFDQLTFFRIDVRNTAFGWSGFSFTSNPIRMWDQLTIADSTVNTLQAGGGNSMFVAATRMAILGNSLDNAGGGEHNFRSMYFDKLVLSNNTFTHPAATKANITLRAPDFGTTNGPLPANTYSQYAVVSDNEAIGFAGVNQPVNTSIDGAHDARTRYIVFERNWLHSYPGSGGGFNAIRLNSDFSTIRNNVIDLSGIATTGDVCIDVRNNTGTSPNPTTNWIYNNTCYSTTAYAGVLFPLKGVSLDATAINTTVKNNLVYSPNAAAPTTAVSVVSNAGTGTIGASGTFGNSTDAQAISGPVTFTSLALPLTPAGAKPTAGYVIGGGVAVPGEIIDFFLSTQPATPDIGAVLH